MGGWMGADPYALSHVRTLAYMCRRVSNTRQHLLCILIYDI